MFQITHTRDLPNSGVLPLGKYSSGAFIHSVSRSSYVLGMQLGREGLKHTLGDSSGRIAGYLLTWWVR